METKDVSVKEQMIFGFRAVEEALLSGKEVQKIFLSQERKGAGLSSIKEFVRERNIPVQFVPKQRLNTMTRGNHQGIIALISPVAFASLENIIAQTFEKGIAPLILMTDGITDVHNLGAIARSAESLGVHALVIPSKDSAPVNAEAIKISSGALLHLSVCRTGNLVSSIQYMKDAGLQVIACTEKSERTIDKIDFHLPSAIVVGSEFSGIGKEILSLADFQVKVPMQGKISSLNVSVAAGIILYEAQRQRMK